MKRLLLESLAQKDLVTEVDWTTRTLQHYVRCAPSTLKPDDVFTNSKEACLHSNQMAIHMTELSGPMTGIDVSCCAISYILQATAKEFTVHWKGESKIWP